MVKNKNNITRSSYVITRGLLGEGRHWSLTFRLRHFWCSRTIPERRHWWVTRHVLVPAPTRAPPASMLRRARKAAMLSTDASASPHTKQSGWKEARSRCREGTTMTGRKRIRTRYAHFFDDNLPLVFFRRGVKRETKHTWIYVYYRWAGMFPLLRHVSLHFTAGAIHI